MMGSFKWKKVSLPVEIGKYSVIYKKFKINRISNYQLWRFITDKNKIFRQLRRRFSLAYRQAYELAQKRGII